MNDSWFAWKKSLYHTAQLSFVYTFYLRQSIQLCHSRFSNWGFVRFSSQMLQSRLRLSILETLLRVLAQRSNSLRLGRIRSRSISYDKEIGTKLKAKRKPLSECSNFHKESFARCTFSYVRATHMSIKRKCLLNWATHPY